MAIASFGHWPGGSPDSAVVNSAMQLQGNRESMANRLQEARIGQTGERLKQKRFGTVWPFFQGAFGDVMGKLGQNQGGTGAASAGGPHINTGPVISAPQLQEQANAMRSRGVQDTQTQQAAMARQAAGQGMGATSPLVQAMQNAAGYANLGRTEGGVSDLRTNAATTNAQHMLSAQQAAEEQFANRQKEQIARQQNLLNFLPGMLSSFGGFV